ncbi:MAG TPA: GGDEF domain-containing protein [Terriglobales bacterium]|nr:GGDEF domain-containing protein [Terriglobales bacterium]
MNIAPMGRELESYDSYPPEKFVVEVFSELSATVVQERWQEVNVILRLSILSGLQMELEATLNLLCDLAAEVISYERALLYFWDDSHEQAQLCATRNLEELPHEHFARGNVLNFWATKYGRPLLVGGGHNLQADAFLRTVEASSALVIPLFVNNRTMGTMQFFSPSPEAFNSVDAQLLWILSLVAENQLTREYANEGLIRFAFTDFLTGLKTRGYFEQQLDVEIKRSERKKLSLTLLMIDIDFFKPFNDQYGHHVGDQILRDVATLLMKDMREVDTVARYGGEEFVIVLPETSEEGATFVAQRLRRNVEQAKFFAGSPNTVVRLTISIGIAVFYQDAQFKRELIENADVALYTAKKTGRNRVVLYSDIAPQQREVS